MDLDSFSNPAYNPDFRLEFLGHNVRDEYKLVGEEADQLSPRLNELNQLELAKVVMYCGDLNKDVVSSYLHSKRHQMARVVIEALDLTLSHITDERLVELVVENFDKDVRRGLKSLVMRGLRRCKLISSGTLTYRESVRILLCVIVLNEIFNMVFLEEDAPNETNAQ
jgi:hypothetical protein